jgi:hypothetical protein
LVTPYWPEGDANNYVIKIRKGKAGLGVATLAKAADSLNNALNDYLKKNRVSRVLNGLGVLFASHAGDWNDPEFRKVYDAWAFNNTFGTNAVWAKIKAEGQQQLYFRLGAALVSAVVLQRALTGLKKARGAAPAARTPAPVARTPTSANPAAIRGAVNTAIRDPEKAEKVATVAQRMLKKGKDDASVVEYLVSKGVDPTKAKDAVAAAQVKPVTTVRRRATQAQIDSAARARAKGPAFEAKSQKAVADRGETIIQSQRRKGSVDEGFDFLSYAGEGKQAKLFINEAKGYQGKVETTAFSCFGLGHNAKPDTLERSIAFAREAIRNQVKDKPTRDVLD